jgi:hypothetical protein
LFQPENKINQLLVFFNDNSFLILESRYSCLLFLNQFMYETTWVCEVFFGSFMSAWGCLAGERFLYLTGDRYKAATVEHQMIIL